MVASAVSYAVGCQELKQSFNNRLQAVVEATRVMTRGQAYQPGCD